jgi:hypothetical protein
MALSLRVPYSQQFTPAQTPLRRLLAVVRQNQGDRKKLCAAIAAAFFKAKATPEKLAGNTVIALKAYGIIDETVALTPLGSRLADTTADADAHQILARQILLNLDGLPLLETLREMRSAAQKIALGSLPVELRKRGFEMSSSSSDLSGVFNWLRCARVLRDNYVVNEKLYGDLVGSDAHKVSVLKGLTQPQILFLRA